MLARLIKFRSSSDSPFDALNDELKSLGATIRVQSRNIKHKNRKCHIFARYIEFWENGMKWLGVDCVDDPKTMAQLIYFWVELRLDSAEIEARVADIKFPAGRKKIEESVDAFLQWYWQNLVDRKDRRFGRLIELFANHAQTRRLMSYACMRDFRFCLNIPPKHRGNSLPFVRINDDGEYEIHTHFGVVDSTGEKLPSKVRAKGSAKEAFDYLLSYLPDNIGPARYEWFDDESSPAA